LARRTEREEHVNICPKCLGLNVQLYMGGSLGKLYRCSDCNYLGPVVIETTFEQYAQLLREREAEEARGLAEEHGIPTRQGNC